MTQTSNLASKAVDSVLKAAKISSNGAEALKVQFQRSAQTLGAGWHGPNDIKTMSGLEGRFLWAEDLFLIRTIAFTFDADKIGFQGSYTLSMGLVPVEKGTFFSVPNNPAIGFAAVTLAPESGAAPRSFSVAGMFTDNEWRIYMAVFNTLGQTQPVQKMFSMTRIA